MRMLRLIRFPIGKKANKKVKRSLLNGILFCQAIIGMVILMVTIFLFPPSAASKWAGIVQFILPNLLLVCVLIQLVVSIWILVKGRLLFSFLSFLLTFVLFCFLFLSVLLVGPSVTNIKKTIETTAHIPSESLKCIGGRLFREAVVVFSCEGVPPALDLSEDASGEPSVVETIGRISVLEGIALGNVQEIRRYPLETSTLLVVRNESGYLVFYLSKVVL